MLTQWRVLVAVAVAGALVVAVLVFVAVWAGTRGGGSVRSLPGRPSLSALPSASVSPSVDVVEPSAGAVAVGPSASSAPTATGFDGMAQSVDDPASYWVVVNKARPLAPLDYEAGDLVAVPVAYANEPYLRHEVADAAVALFAAITAETGLSLQAQSAYRSYSTQERVYAGWVSSLGQEAADLTSARPGHSEHQTGLVIDVNALPDQGCSLQPCWGATPHAQWVAANAHRFGFIVRYPDGKTPITGYEYEPYHLRFVGVELAAEMQRTGVTTLEEFFGLPPAPSY